MNKNLRGGEDTPSKHIKDLRNGIRTHQNKDIPSRENIRLDSIEKIGNKKEK